MSALENFYIITSDLRTKYQACKFHFIKNKIQPLLPIRKKKTMCIQSPSTLWTRVCNTLLVTLQKNAV
jgi:hypothetical protein